MKTEIEINLEDLSTEIAHEVIRGLKPLLAEGQRKTQEDPLMDVKKLSVYLGVKEQWIYERVSVNEIPFIRVGKHLRFRKKAIDDWLKSNETPAMNPLSRRLKAVK